MTYEELDSYFGPPGHCVIYPFRRLGDIAPHPEDEGLMGRFVTTSWRTLFFKLRTYAKGFCPVTYQPVKPYEGVMFRTGVLCPVSIAGQPFRGTVLFQAMSFYGQISPGYMHHPNDVPPLPTERFIIRREADMPALVPPPMHDRHTPKDVLPWWKDYDFPQAQPKLCVDWEELL